MHKLSLVPSDSPILRRVCKEVTNMIVEVLPYINDMRELASKNRGIGLAAPQVGIDKRFFIIHGKVYINPAIIKHGRDMVADLEGCLSFPSRLVSVLRYRIIEVTYFDEEGKEKSEKLTGWMARVFQHEFDHLNGECIIKVGDE